jgi:hypothetical protein
MATTVRFDETSIFHGFTVSYKLNEDISKTLLISETYKRLDGVLESLNLENLRNILRNQTFAIKGSIEQMKEESVILISTI